MHRRCRCPSLRLCPAGRHQDAHSILAPACRSHSGQESTQGSGPLLNWGPNRSEVQDISGGVDVRCVGDLHSSSGASCLGRKHVWHGGAGGVLAMAPRGPDAGRGTSASCTQCCCGFLLEERVSPTQSSRACPGTLGHRGCQPVCGLEEEPGSVQRGSASVTTRRDGQQQLLCSTTHAHPPPHTLNHTKIK